MKKFMKKRFFIFLFPVVAICVTVGALYYSTKDEGLKQSFNVSIEKDQTYRKVYMLDNDNLPNAYGYASYELKEVDNGDGAATEERHHLCERGDGFVMECVGQ